MKEGITLLPAEQTVVEVLETVAPDDLVMAACERLRIAGYRIALDDPGCQMRVEKVETREQFEASLRAGFDCFQGYFFRRPEVLKAREIPTNQINDLRMLQAVSREEIDARCGGNPCTGRARSASESNVRVGTIAQCVARAMHGARGSAGSRTVPLCKTRDTLDLHGTRAAA